ncbi:MAG TPA: thioredoxin [Candidatus Poseidoniales archaeon]|jgi:thioredoxin 1|nr:thioredoxin [Candidatus Poseidoniales archaeon]
MGEVRAVTDATYDETINEGGWVLVDFWAPWCGPCKAIAPVLAEVATEREIIIAKVNTDSETMTAGKLGVRGIPALYLYHDGKLVSNKAGALPKPKLLQWIDEHMSADDF